MHAASGAERHGCLSVPFFIPLHFSEKSEELVRSNRRRIGTGFWRMRLLLAAALLAALGVSLWRVGCGVQFSRQTATAPVSVPQSPSAPVSGLRPAELLKAFQQMSLIFEQNQGQSDPRVKFLARGLSYGLFLTANEAVLDMKRSAAGHSSDNGDLAVRMALAHANPAPIVEGSERLPGISNYLVGKDAVQWHRHLPQYARVRYRSVYPGIDLVYYGNQGRLEYDFEVAPGADPRLIELDFQTAPSITSEGSLRLHSESGDVEFQAPRIYQQIDGRERPVQGRFVLRAAHEVGFELADYDRSRQLVIDPVLTYSTYLGGALDESCSVITGAVKSGCPAIAVDSASNAYIAGSTTSADFPIPTGTTPFQAALNGTKADVFVAKFNPAGTALLFATYLGGTDIDNSAGVAVDAGFNVFVTGTTVSGDFPTGGTIAAYQATAKVAGTHAFLSQLDPTGATLLYSTYLSGSKTDTATGLALDVKGKAYLVGTTNSTDFPTTSGSFQPTSKAANQFFISKIDPTIGGTAGLVYSTYLGGSMPSTGVTLGGGIAVDTSTTPSVYVTGGTDFTDMPVLNAAQSSNSGGQDAFVAKFTPENASGAQEVYLTYVGGTGNDVGYGVTVDSGGNGYVAGSTTSTDFIIPTGTTPFQSTNLGGTDAFVEKISNPASGGTNPNVTFTYFSYLGGSGTDIAYAIAVDTLQNIRITGSTDSTDLTTRNPTQASSGGGTDAFFALIDTATTTGNFSTYLGGTGSDIGTGIAVDSQGASYLAGQTTSSDFPVASPFQTNLDGGSDAFVSKFGPTISLAITATASPTPVGVGNQVSFIYTVTNNGDPVNGITFSDVLPTTGATFVSATSSPGSCGGATGSPATVTCSVGTLGAAAVATVTVVVTPTVAGPLGNSGTVSVVGSTFTAAASASATVNDFAIGVAPASQTVPAGAAANYTVTVTPLPTFPESISLSCSSGLPSGATCTFTTNPLPNANDGPVTSSLAIGTTVRPIVTGANNQQWPIYATWLPVGGFALIGIGLGTLSSRKWRAVQAVLFAGLISLILFQPACGSSNQAATVTSGTPAGTYAITVTATSGSAPATRTAALTLVVQ